MDVRLPDGTMVKNVPEGTTKAQLLEKLERKGAMPESMIAPETVTKAKSNFALGATREFLQGQTLGFSDELGSAAAASFVAGMEAVTKGANPVEVFNREYPLMVEGIRADQEQFRDENPKTSLGLQVVGGLATGGAAAGGKQVLKQGTKQVVKQGAKLGAVAGAGFSDSEEFFAVDTALDSALGSVTGAVAAPILSKALGGVSKGVKRLIGNGKIKVVDEKGQVTKEAVDELSKKFGDDLSKADEAIKKQLIDDGVLTPEQAQRFNLFAKRKITPLRANITQKADDFIELNSAAKGSNEVSQTIAKQDEQLINLAKEGVDNIGPSANSLTEASQRTFRVVDDIVTKLDDTVSEAYQAAGLEAKGQPRVVLSKLIDEISNNRGNEKISKGVISAAKQLLVNKGALKKGASIDINKRGHRATGDEVKKLTVSESEEIRQGLNALYDSASPQGKRIIFKLKNAIDDDVSAVVGEDIFADARAAKVSFQRIIERGKRNKFDKSNRSFLEKVINNQIPEEKIAEKLLSSADDDFSKFKNFLMSDSGEQGVQAFNDIKANVLDDAINKAIGTAGKAEGGGSVFNVNIFKREIVKLKKNGKKYNELYNADEQQLIDDIIEIGKLRLPVSGTATGKGPTELAVKELKSEIFKRIPVVGEKAQSISEAVGNLNAAKRQLDPLRQTIDNIQ